MEKSATVASIAVAMDKAFTMLKNLRPDTASVRIAFASSKVDIAYFNDMLADEKNLPDNLAEVLCCYPDRISQSQKDTIINCLCDQAINRYLVSTGYLIPSESLLNPEAAIAASCAHNPC